MYADEPEKVVYTKQEPGSSIMSVYYKFKVPHSMLEPLTLMSEPDLFKEWMPSIIKSNLLASLSDWRKIV